MLYSCKYCGKIHEEDYACKKKPVAKKKKDDTVRLRNTADWKYMRDKIKKRDNYFCQICIRNLYGTRRQYNFENFQVHHAVPINTDKSLGLASSNLLTLCPMHHHMCDCGEIPYEEVKGIIDQQEKAIPTEFDTTWNLNMQSAKNTLSSEINPINSEPRRLIINIENFVNNRTQDVQAFAKELEFYSRRNSLILG